MSGASLFGRFAAWGADATGSTRPAALMRIGLSAVALVRFGSDLILARAGSPEAAALGVLFFVLAGAAFFGYRSRIAIGGLGLLVFGLYAQGVSGLGPPQWGHHHVYILGMSCVLLSLTDCGRSFSVDRALDLAARGQEGAAPEHGMLWGQRLIVLQMSALYFWTAVDKSDWAFVSGQRLEQVFVWTYAGRTMEVLLAYPVLLAVMSILVVVVEYWLAIAILLPRSRRLAIPVGLSLHAAFYIMLPVDTYSITMMLLYLALFDPGAVHRFIDRMVGRPDPSAGLSSDK